MGDARQSKDNCTVATLVGGRNFIFTRAAMSLHRVTIQYRHLNLGPKLGQILGQCLVPIEPESCSSKTRAPLSEGWVNSWSFYL